MYGSTIPVLVIVLIITIIVFFICREIFCWYWKQTEQVELLKDIKDLLEQQLKTTVPQKKISKPIKKELTLNPNKLVKCGLCNQRTLEKDLKKYMAIRVCPDCYKFKNPD